MLKNWNKNMKALMKWMSWVMTFNIKLMSLHIKTKKSLTDINKEVLMTTSPTVGIIDNQTQIVT